MTARDENFAAHIRLVISKGDPESIEDIVNLILESEEAKSHLRNKGYGVTGMGILATCKEVPDADTGL